MGDDDVFSRRWMLTEDELLRMLWRCHAGENPDVVLLELYANDRGDRRGPRQPFGGRPSRTTRHIHRDRQKLAE
jgi:hypothetical protein